MDGKSGELIGGRVRLRANGAGKKTYRGEISNNENRPSGRLLQYGGACDDGADHGWGVHVLATGSAVIKLRAPLYER